MHVLSANVKINLKLPIVFANVSICLCVVKKSGNIGHNQENRDEIIFGARLPSKHDNYDRIYQVTLHCKEICKIFKLCSFFRDH